MSIVVISGSRSISRLNQEAIWRINKIIELQFSILIGDCPQGADKLVQNYLKSVAFEDVLVFHIGLKPRYNAGFKTFKCESCVSYRMRDAEMCKEAIYGLALWDGVSPGTKANIERVRELPHTDPSGYGVGFPIHQQPPRPS